MGFLDTSKASDTCPPHPGFLRGMCIRCGQLQTQESREQLKAEGQPLSLKYLHKDLEMNKEYVLLDRAISERVGTSWEAKGYVTPGRSGSYVLPVRNVASEAGERPADDAWYAW